VDLGSGLNTAKHRRPQGVDAGCGCGGGGEQDGEAVSLFRWGLGLDARRCARRQHPARGGGSELDLRALTKASALGPGRWGWGPYRYAAHAVAVLLLLHWTGITRDNPDSWV
jgi:hypothetical protein